MKYVLLKLADDFHARLKARAALEQRSMQKLVFGFLEEGMAEEQKAEQSQQA
jgi:plasmid stability protein